MVYICYGVGFVICGGWICNFEYIVCGVIFWYYVFYCVS